MLKTAATKAAGEKEPQAYPRGYVEDCFEPRTKPWDQRVSAREGWAGETVGVFSISYSDTGINCLIQAPKLPGFRLWM